MVKRKNESGQAIIEYVLLLAIIATAFLVASRGLGKLGIADKLTRPVKQDFAAAYRYGHPKAKGSDEGGFELHPRAIAGGGNNFRIFINPTFR